MSLRIEMKKTICFDDVLLTPQYSEIMSRKEIQTTSPIANSVFDIPVVSSPMDTVTGHRMATAMSNLGGLGIIHRYNTVKEQAKAIHTAHAAGATNIGAAVGVSGDYLDRARAAIMAGSRFICVDIAHGHHILMKNALKNLRSLCDESVTIIAGNVATLEGFNDLSDWGAHAVRVGIGGGSICSTRIQTGHGMPTLQSIMECSKSDRDTVLIADGGIKNSGDVTKAIAAGADFVMLGSLLSGTDETPGDIMEMPEIVGGQQVYCKYKTYRGMASVEAQIDWRGHTSSVEGVSSVVKYKGPVSVSVDEIMRGLKSGMSYSGAKTISEFQAKSRFVGQTQGAQLESSTHINRV